MTNEKEIWEKYGGYQKDSGFLLGPHTSFQFKHSPRRVLFSLSRYKFAQKMIGRDKSILDLGCSDGFGTYLLSEIASSVVGVDFDKEAIDWANRELVNDKLSFECDNFLGKIYREFDAIVAFDVIEHIFQVNEALFFETICNNLSQYGIAIIGTPNVISAQYSSKVVNDAHVNMYTSDRLESMMQKYFYNVFSFYQNDEIIHTGFPLMAHYLISIGCNKRRMGV